MAGAAMPTSTVKANIDTNKSYLFPFILVTSLFFLWGFAYGLLDVLNKHFQDVLEVTKRRSTLLQFAYFGAYFLMALPAGFFMNKFGYKKGILLGLMLYAIGAFLFYPAAGALSFNGFLAALFILASGLACLETAANPYVTVLGKSETSEFRLNLSQCFNGLGSALGALIGGQLFLEDKTAVANAAKDLSIVQITYVVIGVVVVLIAMFFFRTPLPEIREEEQAGSNAGTDVKPLFSHSHFVWGIITQFFYVAAQVGVAALFINYVTEYWQGTSGKKASSLLSIGLTLFLVGRFVGTAIMRKIRPNKLLMIYAFVNILLCMVVMSGKGQVSVYALMTIFFFMSIMFPSIFALGLKDLGVHTKRASSFQIMSIVGGAIVPFIMGSIADSQSTALAYSVPMLCFAVVFYFGGWGYKQR
jgi:FHS family L-fucose permease-like MFS transporter